MDIELDHVASYVEGLAEDIGGPRKLASRIGVSHQTIYNIMAGGWPSKAVADALKLRILVPTKKVRSHLLHKSLQGKANDTQH